MYIALQCGNVIQGTDQISQPPLKLRIYVYRDNEMRPFGIIRSL